MINSPFNYTGSKYKLLEQILPHIDYTKQTFVDLFCGGGSVYTIVLDKYDKIIVNDVIEDLIGIHKGLIKSNDIIEQTKLLCPNKDDQDGYVKLRNSYNEEKTPEKLYALMVSCLSNMIRFNLKGEVNQSFGRRTWNSNIERKVYDFCNHIRPYKNKINYISSDFEKVEILKDTMYYIDPPYSNTEAGYSTLWKKQDDNRLYSFVKLIDDIGSSFMVSGSLVHGNKPSILLDLLLNDGYQYVELDFDYKKVSRKEKETKEIIIKNYE